MDISSTLDQITDLIYQVPENKKYWVVRTFGGEVYDLFVDGKYVSINHNNVSLSVLADLRKRYGSGDEVKILKEIKDLITKSYKDTSNKNPNHEIGRIANQIYKFYFEMKKGDIVVIPDTDSRNIRIGQLTENHIAQFTNYESQLGEKSILNRRVQWIKEFNRRNMDPMFAKIFSNHRAVSDVTQYAQYVERSMHDLFIIKDEAHLIMRVGTHDGINARKFFEMGTILMDLIDEFSHEHELGFSSKDLEITLNINSPGLADWLSNMKRIIGDGSSTVGKQVLKGTVFLGILSFLAGGHYEHPDGTKIGTEGVPGLLNAVSNFLDANEDRRLKTKILEEHFDSLQVKGTEDILLILDRLGNNKIEGN